jgi:hypothetical protein
VAHSVLVSADHVLDRGVAYQELGDDYFFQQRHSARTPSAAAGPPA